MGAEVRVLSLVGVASKARWKVAGKGDTLSWVDVEDLGALLAERRGDVDPWSVSFTRLKQLVKELPEFEEQPGHPCNERILEEIQRAWIEEKEGRSNEEA